MTARKPCRCGREKSLGKGKKLCDVCLPLWRAQRRQRGLDRLAAWGEKVQNISQCQSMEALLTEIEKCDVVCAICHRIRTWNRRVAQELTRAG